MPPVFLSACNAAQHKTGATTALLQHSQAHERTGEGAKGVQHGSAGGDARGGRGDSVAVDDVPVGGFPSPLAPCGWCLCRSSWRYC